MINIDGILVRIFNRVDVVLAENSSTQYWYTAVKKFYRYWNSYNVFFF